MSRNAVPVADGKSNFPSIATDSPSADADDLTPEQKDALIARAKDIIAGRVRPSALVIPPEIERLLQRDFEGFDPPPAPEAIRNISERLSLEAHYQGQPVVCFTTTDGVLTVLAVGEREIRELYQELSHDEKAKVIITDTLQC